MAAISFPTSPIIGQQFVVDSNTYVWDGTAWEVSTNDLTISFSDLIDVNVSGATADDVLKYDGTNWVPGTIDGGFVGSTGTLAARPTSPTTNYLYIVSGNTPSNQNGRTYFYNLATTTWVELDTTISNRNLDELFDVESTFATLGQVLMATSGVYKFMDLFGTGTLAARPTVTAQYFLYVVTGDSTASNNGRAFVYSKATLSWIELDTKISNRSIDDLSDVAVSGAASGDVLQFDGTNWVPGTASSSASLSSLTDATITSPSNGQILRYSTTTSKWSNSNESSRERFRNKIVNGDFNVMQREDYSTIQPAAPTTKFYNYDKWYFQQSSSSPYFQFRSGLQFYLDYPSQVRNSIFIGSRQSVAIANGDLYGWFQDIEAYDLEDINIGYATAKPMTLSFWIRSSVAGEYPVSLNIGTSYSFVSSYTITAETAADNTVLQYVTISIPPFTAAVIPTYYTDYMMTLSFGLGVGTNFRTATSNAWVSGNYYANTTSLNLTASASRVLILGKVQLEKGTVATEFETVDYSVALQKCRRYYYSIDSLKGDDSNLERFIGGMGTVRSTTTQGTVRVVHPVRMRKAPVVTQTGTIRARDAGTYSSTATLLSQTSRTDATDLTFTLATAGSTLRPIFFNTEANSGRLEFSAEF